MKPTVKHLHQMTINKSPQFSPTRRVDVFEDRRSCIIARPCTPLFYGALDTRVEVSMASIRNPAV